MANVRLIVGEDDYLVSEAAKKTVGDGVGLEVVDSLNSTNADLQLADLREVDASFSTPPFLDPRKVTWWKNVHFLPHTGGKAVAADVKEALEKFAAKVAAASLPDNQFLVISGPHLLKTSVFAKRLGTVSEVVSFARGKPYEEARAAAARVTEQAAERGLAFDRGAAELFVSRVGTDTRSLLGELDKMRDYLGPDARTITAAAIDEVTSPGVGQEPEVWAITDALGERNLAKALAATARFERESGFAVLVTTVVEKFFRQLLDVRNGGGADLNPYVRGKLNGYLRNWTPLEIRLARGRFLLLREKVVSGLTCGDVLVVKEIVQACRRGK